MAEEKKTNAAPSKAVTAAQELVSAGVSVVLGSYGSGASMAGGTVFDASQIPAFALEGFSWAVAEGIVKGTSATTLDPMTTTNRIQICLMVCRLLSEQD